MSRSIEVPKPSPRISAVIAVVSIICLAGLLTSCDSPTDSAERGVCEWISFGLMPPTDCAHLKGRAVSPTGEAITFRRLRVDSIYGDLGYFYFSDYDITDASGEFELTVYRKSRYQARSQPDTVTLSVKAYEPASPTQTSDPLDAAEIRLTFSPIGERWVVTRGTVTFEDLEG